MAGGGSALLASSSSAAADASAPIENVAELQFGPEFQDIHVLSNAQVAVVLQVSAASAVNRDEELNEVYRKTQKYVDRFNTMTNPEKDHQELVDELDNLQEYVMCRVLHDDASCCCSFVPLDYLTDARFPC